MTRQETLSSKQKDLEQCLSSRDSKLRELYRATVTFQRSQTRGLGPLTVHDSEASFLKANDLSQGRFFNQSTLPHVNSIITAQASIFLKSKSARSLDARESTSVDEVAAQQSQNGVENQKRGNSPQQKENSDTQITTTPPPAEKKSLEQDADTKSNFLLATDSSVEPTIAEHVAPVNLSSSKDANLRIESSPGQELFAEVDTIAPDPAIVPKCSSSGELVRSEPSVNSSKTLAVTSNNGGTIFPVPTTEPGPEKASLSPQASHKPSEETQHGSPRQDKAREERSEHIKNDPNPDSLRSVVSDELAPLLPTPRKNSSSFEHVDDNADSSIQSQIHPSRLNQGANDTLATPNEAGKFKSQAAVARLEAPFTGTPSTPDEQLRLEETQSLQHLNANVSLLNESTRASSQSEKAISTTAQFLREDLGEELTNQGTTPTLNEGRKQSQATTGEQYEEQCHHTLHSSMGLRERAFSSLAGDASKDPTLSRRPPMRIDTGIPPTREVEKSTTTAGNQTPNSGNTNTLISSSANQKSTPWASQAPSPPERMTTRVSSGAIRHRSVSEILGETPKSAVSNADKGSFERRVNDAYRDDLHSQTSRRPSATTSSDAMTFKLRLNELKEKERSKLSTVIFARPQQSHTSLYTSSSESQQLDAKLASLESKDYLQTLFAMQAIASTIAHPLHSLIASAHKTLSTSNHYTNLHQQQDYRILERIFQLQSLNRWSFRQLERSLEPDRPTTHWDVLVSHSKWMRTDFKEERKWKVAAAKAIADSCARWVRSSIQDRLSSQVRTRPVHVQAEIGPLSIPTPELIPSTEDDSSVGTDSEPPNFELVRGSAPAAIFSLAPEMFCFGIEKTPATEKLLQELPLYQPAKETQDAALHGFKCASDTSWKTPLVPISKFIQGKLLSHEQGPPRKRSRYDYQDAATTQQGSANAVFSSFEPFAGGAKEPEQDNVALFNPENKHIRDRIHAGHAFRFPSDYVIPSQSFFESRQSSQWTQGEDDELRRLVREFAYNWSLISSCLSSPSLFSSSAERRTPWECFERWIGLEGLPAEMSKTLHFRTYQSRLQGAQKTLEAQQQALHNGQGNSTPQHSLRRRTTQPCPVDRRRNDKHLRLVDAMRKLAKKRETALQKQQHVAGLAAMRKANEAVQPRSVMHTPQAFSRMKYERETKMRESYRQQILQQQQQQKAALAQKASQQPGQQSGGSHGVQPNRHPAPTTFSNGINSSVSSSLPNGQIQGAPLNRTPIPQVPRLTNGIQSNGTIPVPGNPPGAPHASMQPHPMQHRMPSQINADSMRIYQEATRVQAEQRGYLLQRQQQNPLPNSHTNSIPSPNMGTLKLMSQNGSSMLANLQGGRSGSPSTSNATLPLSGPSSSPRLTTPSQPQQLSSGVVPAVNQISNQIKTRHPLASPEQITKMTTDTLNYHITQAAMQAAAGTNISSVSANLNLSTLPALQQQQQQVMMNGVNGSPGRMNPQQYSQMMRNHQSNQQSNQQNRNSAGAINGAARPASRGVTPRAQGVPPQPSQSPRPGQAQMAGTS